MNPEPPHSPAPASSPVASPAPTSPVPASAPVKGVVRELNQVDYHELRTNDMQSVSFLEGPARDLVVGEKSPLRRLLASATLAVDKGKLPARRSVTYDLPPDKFKERRPLDAIPKSVLEEFEQAAREFYDKVLDGKANEYEKKLRLEFRLPNPFLEPESYQVYGSNFERRLVILWGAEKKKGTALPLIHHKVLNLDPKAPTVASELRKLLIGWPQMEKDAVHLLALTKEPLWRFVVNRVKNPGTGKEGFTYPSVPLSAPAPGGAAGAQSAPAGIPKDATRPLTRLLPREMKQFYKACQEFYARAEVSDCPPYERELRREFKLPDPAKSPASYLVHGSPFGPKLLVVFEGTDGVALDKWTWLTPYKPLGIPPAPAPTPEQQALGEKAPSVLTVTEQLARKTLSYAKISSIAAGSIALMAAVIGALIVSWMEKKPINLLAAEGTSKNTITVEFDKVIRPDSVVVSNFGVFLAPPTGETAKDNLKVKSVAPKSGDNKKVILTLETQMIDHVDYDVQADRIQSTAMLARPPKSLNKRFTFSDNVPPRLEPLPSAGDDIRSVRVEFSKEMNADAIRNPEAYAIGSEKPESVSSEPGNRVAFLTFATPRVKNRDYELKVRGELLVDTAHRPNQVTNKSVMFKYVDRTAPKLMGHKAIDVEGEPNRVFLTFNELLDPVSAVNASNYSVVLRGPPVRELKVYEARFGRSSTNLNHKEVELLTDALVRGAGYELRIRGVADQADPKNPIPGEVVRPFGYDGVENNSGPSLETPRYDGNRKLTAVLKLSNRLARDARVTKGNFSLQYTAKNLAQPVNLSHLLEGIGDITPGGNPPGLVEIQVNLTTKLNAGAYILELKGLSDVWGHTNSTGLTRSPSLNFGEIPEFTMSSREMKGPRTLILSTYPALNIDEFLKPGGNALAEKKFVMPNAKVVSVKQGENEFLIELTLDREVAVKNVGGFCSGLRLKGMAEGIETPRVDFGAPR